jgi:hypothetical protein
MKFLLIALFIVLAFVAQAQLRNALVPKGKMAAMLTLVNQGKPVYTILLSAKPTTQDRKAAEDLQHWIQEMSGAKLPIVSEPAKPKGKVVSIGVTELSGRNEGAEEVLGDDGYGIAVRDGNLFLWGGRGRGIVNAVYALLEEDFNCRWYTNESIRIPKRTTVQIAPVPRTYTPQLRLRDPFYKVSFDATWSLRNRTNAPDAPVSEEWGGHMDYGPLFCHTFHQLVPPDRYFKDHPEYYALGEDGKRYSWQLCTTNPDTVRIVTEAVLKHFRENPNAEIACVFKSDGGGNCYCPTCKALREAEGADMACQLFMVNQVAEAVEKEFPRATVDTLAYLDTIGVPKTVRPRKNVAIRLCNDSVGAWTHPFTPAEKCDVAKLAEAWSAVCNRIYIWDYNVNFSHYLAPMPNMEVIAANIRFWVKNHAEGIMTQGAYQSPGAERDEMRSWVIAKLMWDPTLDLHELMLDFTYGHYGIAAPAIAEYDKLLRKAGEEHAKDLESPPDGIRYRMDSPFLSFEFLHRASALFARAEKLAETDAILRRVERAELPILYVQLSRGPAFVGDGYPEILDKFTRIAHEVGTKHLREGDEDTDRQIAAWRKTWEDYKAKR